MNSLDDLYPITERPYVEYKVDGKTFLSRYDADKHRESILARPTWREYAATHFASLMPLYTAEEVVEKFGWGDLNSLTCCGQPVDVSSFLGDATNAKCLVCGKEAACLWGPQISGACARFLDFDQFRREGDDPIWVIIPSPITNGGGEA